MQALIEQVYADTGKPVSIYGHSMGWYYNHALSNHSDALEAADWGLLSRRLAPFYADAAPR